MMSHSDNKLVVGTVIGSVIGSVIGPIVGYKAFDNDLTCLGYQFRVGDTYQIPDDQNLEICHRGFHFCRIPVNCNDHYPLPSNPTYPLQPRHALIRAWDVIDDDEKNLSVCRKIEILKEIPLEEWRQMSGVMTGYGKTFHFANGGFHRDSDMGPAIHPSGSESGPRYWYNMGRLHRDDGPAITTPLGNSYWYKHGTLTKISFDSSGGTKN
jgi:hypothetical protein